MTDEQKWEPMDPEWIEELHARAHLDPVLRFELYCVFELGRTRGWDQALSDKPVVGSLANPFSLTSMDAWVASKV